MLDIFPGSNTAGRTAEELDRRWLAFEKDRATSSPGFGLGQPGRALLGQYKW